MKMKYWWGAAVLGASTVTAAHAASVTFTFDNNVTNNNAANAAAGGQFSVEVSDTSVVSGTLGAGQVAFIFRNAGPGSSSITRIYFEDGPMSAIASIHGSDAAVNFSPGASPPGLPGGAPFGFTVGQPGATFSLMADASPPANGVHAGQWLEVIFDLQPGASYSDVVTAIEAGMSDPLADGRLLIGIHVQAFPGAESFALNPEFALIPLPPAAWMGLAGLAGVAAVRRRRSPPPQPSGG